MIALAQLDPVVGDLAGNLARMREAVDRAASCALVCFPEMAVTGYPPLDLLDRPSFVDAAASAFATWLGALPAGAPAILAGTVDRNPGPGRPLRNVAVFARDGRVVSVHPKTLLPTYDVFDEDRWFEPYDGAPSLVTLGGLRLGVTLCEDLWTDEPGAERPRYAADPVASVVEAGADVVVNLSASPFSAGKDAERRALCARHARRHGRPVLYLNQVGGNDGLVFDGRSFVVDARGAVVARAAAFAEDLLAVDPRALPPPLPVDDAPAVVEIADALVLGIRDYFRKTGTATAVLGLSGGIDSAVTAALAVDALGPDRVVGLAMPSEFSSPGSLADARTLASNLGIRFHVVPIQPALEAMRASLADALGPRPWGLADENLQARVRGQILMAFSNRHGHLVLSTGNKSELAVGYCTLYGDMCGGLAVVSDVPKTMVYRLAHHLNRDGERIPRASIEKPPSAELRPDQRDDQSLPPYDVLDAVLHLYVEERMEVADIAARGHARDVVERVVRMVDRAEHKRRQMPVGLRVTAKAFGAGRRLPIAQRWTDHPER